MELQNEKYMTEGETAEFTKFSKSKLQNDRWKKKGIPYLKIDGKKILYKMSDIISYLEKHRIIPKKFI